MEIHAHHHLLLLQEPTLDTMQLQAPRKLPWLVKSAFDSAREAGHLIFYPTHVALLSARSVPFQLRFSPSLASKPVNPRRDDHATPATFRNPFSDPDPTLLVTNLGHHHNLILNKFAIVPEHFILATREFAPQTHVLDEADLAATYACIRAYRRVDEEAEGEAREEYGEGEEAHRPSHGELFAFFNSGPHSGASQPHRHIQLLPVERMRDGLAPEERERWHVLADRLGQQQNDNQHDHHQADADLLSFETFHAEIDPDSMTPKQLHETYLLLLHRATVAVAAFHEHDDNGHCADLREPPKPGEEARISYNLGMTARSLVVCPRLAEGAVLVQGEGEDADVVCTMALNGTVLAGTALVKNVREWDALRADEGALRRMLGGIGVPRGACRRGENGLEGLDRKEFMG